MGANKCLLGPRDVAEHLLPAAAAFVLDSTSPLTRFYGRVIFATLYQHPQFEKLMRRFLTPPVYRSVSGILESVKRRVRDPEFLSNLTLHIYYATGSRGKAHRKRKVVRNKRRAEASPIRARWKTSY